MVACGRRRHQRWPNAHESQRAIAIAHARQALGDGNDDASVIGLAGFILVMLRGDVMNGLAALRRATMMNPNHAAVCGYAGTANLFEGDLAEALEHLQRTRRFSPSDPTAFMTLSTLACVLLMMGESQEALAVCAEAAARYADMDFTWWIAACAAGHTADLHAARDALANLTRLSGRPLCFPAFERFSDPARRAIMLEALRREWPR